MDFVQHFTFLGKKKQDGENEKDIRIQERDKRRADAKAAQHAAEERRGNAVGSRKQRRQ